MAARQAHILRKKQSILALEKHLDKKIIVECIGERELVGVLKGFDSNMNIVLGESTETFGATKATRKLGAAIVRGGFVVSVLPATMSEKASFDA